jgi:hypothetical protein
MSSFRKPLIGTALALGCLASVSVGCLTASGAEPAKGSSLPASVRGVPMLELAKHTLGAAEAYSVSKPFNVRAVITTQAALYAQIQTAGGSTVPEYVVTLRGRFTCGYCGAAMPTSTTTTNPETVHVSTMVLELPIPLANGATTGVAVGVGTPDLAKLGHTYNLDRYVKSLAGVKVPRGPVPGG